MNQEKYIDESEWQDWQQAMEDLLAQGKAGADKAGHILSRLIDSLEKGGGRAPIHVSTPYVNTISRRDEPVYPGDYGVERQLKSIIRWNALAMVLRANHAAPGIGGHLSTYASAATLYEVGFNHFFKARTDTSLGDMIYFQGHASPGIYARAFLEGRLTETQLVNFRRELAAGGGLSSYPHPRLMPEFWQFPTVSMGLGPIMAIYQARFNRYMEHRGLCDTSSSKVWAFLGDGECDEPESLGAITLAARENLDNLIFVVNCNLQRLDGPVRGNGKIIQELEAIFHGAGWQVIKVIWGGDWDPLLEADATGLLRKRMAEALDGDYQKYSVESGAYIREHFFGKYPELLKLVEPIPDEKLERLTRGGHDSRKVYAAYQQAVASSGQPTVILAKTIKGYGLGDAGEGQNIAHSQKKMEIAAIRRFCERFNIPITLTEETMAEPPFFKPVADSEEMRYLKARREALGGFVPKRVVPLTPPSPARGEGEIPILESLSEFLQGSGNRDVSTTMGFVRLLSHMMALKKFGAQVVPIIPDEARTFGMESLFRQFGIYSSQGQRYEPVDKSALVFYHEARDGQILEEGITEAGAMSSFIAAGTAYASLGRPMVPFYLFYSMFGFQRIGDLIWAAADSRARGFLLGATAGRTTLLGEGLQHQDGHSHLIASAVPSVCAYDPAFVYEIAVLVCGGLRRMMEDNEDIIYYLTLYNETVVQRALPEGDPEIFFHGIRRGLYLLEPSTLEGEAKIHILASGPMVYEALKAKQQLEDDHRVSTEVWSVTSFSELRRDALETKELSHIVSCLKDRQGRFIGASDYVALVPEQIRQWVPGDYRVLGTDGFGLSEAREELRHHFKVDAASIVKSALE